MTYLLFLIIAVVYNIRKFHKMKDRILVDLRESNEVRRNSILSHFYWVFVVELFLGLIVADWLSRNGDFPAQGLIYVYFIGIFLSVSLISFFIYQVFLKWVCKEIDTDVRDSFNRYLSKEFRISFALGFLPILLYSLMTRTFMDENEMERMGVDLFGHILFVSVLSIICTVTVMMKLIPNCEVTEPEFLDIIQRRLQEANLSYIRVRWIEAEFKNAFVVGINFPFFKHQTMFIGRSLRTILNDEEFDAVICHEVAHIRQGHMAKRLISIFWHILRCSIGSIAIILSSIFLFTMIFGIEGKYYAFLSTPYIVGAVVLSFILSYFLFFAAIRSQEYEADAIAVLDFGCRIEVLESAIKKIMTSDNPYQKQKKATILSKFFSTHPSLEDRVEMLQKKVNEGLPFDHRISFFRRMSTFSLALLQPKFFAPLALMLCLGIYFGINNVQKFSEQRFVFANLTDEELINNQYLNNNVNDRPLIGHSNLYYVMSRKNPQIIDHFLSRGADPEKVMYYLNIINDPRLTARYVHKLSDRVSEHTIDKALSSIREHKDSQEIIGEFSSSPKYEKWMKKEKGQKRLPASATSTQLDNQQ